MMRKKMIFKSTLFLLMAFYVFVGCQKDDALTPQQQNEEQHAESRFARTQIDFKTFKSKISDTKVLADIERKMHKNTPKSGGTNEFILYIDTSRIIEYSNDSITTYTMTVITSDQDTEKFTNIVLKEDKGVVTTYLLRYTPTEQWKEDTLNGNKGPFSGVISILDNDGTVLFEAEVEDYMEINSTSFSACSATIEPMMYCTNPNNPNPYVCVCGVSFVVGYVVVYGEDCSGNGGGPNDDPFDGGIPGSGGGEGDGGTEPGYPNDYPVIIGAGVGIGGGEFPTEPNFDYMLIHNLNALLQPPLTFQQEEWIMANEENYQFALEILAFIQNNSSDGPFNFELVKERVEGDLPPSCKAFEFSNVTSNWQAAGVKNIVALIGHYYNGEFNTANVLFSQPIYFEMPRNSSANGGYISSGLAAELSAEALFTAIQRTKTYFIATDASQSQVQAKLWDYIRDEMENGTVIGGKASFTPPLGFNGTVNDYKSYWFFEDNCD